jgi:hypothetical protein
MLGEELIKADRGSFAGLSRSPEMVAVMTRIGEVLGSSVGRDTFRQMLRLERLRKITRHHQNSR